MEAVGEFGSDNRAGIQGTLHRISGLRNRQGRIIGLTCRVGRAVTGHADIIRDVLEGEPCRHCSCLCMLRVSMLSAELQEVLVSRMLLARMRHGEQMHMVHSGLPSAVGEVLWICYACSCRALQLAQLLGLVPADVPSIVYSWYLLPRPQAPPPCCSWAALAWARPPASGRWLASCRMSCAGERELHPHTPAPYVHASSGRLHQARRHPTRFTPLATCLPGCAAALPPVASLGSSRPAQQCTCRAVHGTPPEHQLQDSC